MAQLTPIRGFSNTPVSRAICVVVTVLAVALSVMQVKHYVRLGIDPYVTEYSQYWRIATYQTSVVNESDYMLSVLLWFQYKNLERFYGSRKYASLVTVFGMYNALVCFVVMCLGQIGTNFAVYVVAAATGGDGAWAYRATIFNLVTPGPLGILSSLYICYGTYIPTSYKFKILLSKPSAPENEAHPANNSSRELILTNHFMIHILYTLLLLNNGVASIIPCLVGLVIGKLHAHELLPGAQKWLLPWVVFKLVSSPRKFFGNALASMRNSLNGGYQSVDTTEPVADEDAEEVLDEGRSNANANEIRAETPVRPLGSQFLDTFRT